MISRDLRFDEFLHAMRGRDFGDVMEAAMKESAEAQQAHRNVPRRTMSKRPALNYYEQLSSLVFFLRNGVKPAGLSNEDFKRIQPLCEEWIAKGQMNNAVLDLFQG